MHKKMVYHQVETLVGLVNDHEMSLNDFTLVMKQVIIPSFADAHAKDDNERALLNQLATKNLEDKVMEFAGGSRYAIHLTSSESILHQYNPDILEEAIGPVTDPMRMLHELSEYSLKMEELVGDISSYPGPDQYDLANRVDDIKAGIENMTAEIQDLIDEVES